MQSDSLDVARALKRLADAGASERFVVVPPTVRLILVARMRSAGLIETLEMPVQAKLTPQGAAMVPAATASLARAS